MHGIVLVPDHTIFFQIAIFFACYFVLKQFIYGPFLALQEARYEKGVGLKEKAAEAREEITRLKAEYEEKMTAHRKKALDWSDAERQKISAEESVILEAARSRVGESLEKVRKGVKEESKRARIELLSKVPEFASEMTGKIMGGKSKVSPSSFKVSAAHVEMAEA